MLKTIQKIGPVLDLFSCEQPEWGVSEVADTIGVPRSSAHALLTSLVDTGLLQCRGRGRYRIGWRVVELGQTLRATTDVRSAAADAMQRLVDVYGETCHLAVMDRHKTFYVEKVVGTRVVNVMGARVGSHADMHCAAIGKVLFAACEPQEIRRILHEKPLRRYTAATITDPATLKRELDKVRSAGFAMDAGEGLAEVRCVAAPIRDDLGAVVASISVSVPATRFTPAQHDLRRAVTGAAADITGALANPGGISVSARRSEPVAAIAS
jgi:DNA-binding IclR family transcriptional regulator